MCVSRHPALHKARECAPAAGRSETVTHSRYPRRQVQLRLPLPFSCRPLHGPGMPAGYPFLVPIITPSPGGPAGSFGPFLVPSGQARTAQVQVAAQVMPVAERIERSAVFDMPDLAAMPTAATNDWMSAAHPGLVVTLPDV